MTARWVIIAALVWAATAGAQIVALPEREVEVSRQYYDNAQYQEALKRAREAMTRSNFTDEQRAKLHEIAGLSAFNLGDVKGAQQHLMQLLLLDPDRQLDPFAVAPPAIKFFEQVRKDNAEALVLARQQLALRAEQAKKAKADAAEAERRREEDERRRRLEAQTQKSTIRVVELRSMLVNFVPFGAGQFQQGRIAIGAAFAVSEAVTAITSVIAYFAINALYADYTMTLPDRLTPDGTYTFTVRRIPPSRVDDYRVWSYLKYIAGSVFYALWAGGVADALVHHRSEVVTDVPATPTEPVKTGLRLELFPLPAGLGAGFAFDF